MRSSFQRVFAIVGSRTQRHAPLNSLNSLLVVIILSCCATKLLAADCEPLDSGTRDTLFKYLQIQLRLSPTVTLSILDVNPVGDTCYRRLTVGGTALKSPLILYLSPDMRFVSSSLYDLTVKPEDLQTIAADKLNSLLLSYPSPETGPREAPVTVVVFSDFQCPFCKQLDSAIPTLDSIVKSQIRLVYKYLPSSSHPWAFSAGRVASCAYLQSNSAFWVMHEFFFREQEKLSAATFRATTLEFARSAALDSEALMGCADRGEGDPAIIADAKLAQRLGLSVTPTVFINGHRYDGPPPEFSKLIRGYLRQSALGDTIEGSTR